MSDFNSDFVNLIKSKYKNEYIFEKIHPNDKILLGFVIHYNENLKLYEKPVFWEEIRNSYKEMFLNEFGKEPCGEFIQTDGTICINEIASQKNDKCISHSTSNVEVKLGDMMQSYSKQIGYSGIQTCRVCLLQNKESVCPYFGIENICSYEKQAFDEIVQKIRDEYGSNIDYLTELKISQLAINVVINLRSIMLLSNQMYVFDKKSTLEIHPAFRVFKDTSSRIESYIKALTNIATVIKDSPSDNKMESFITEYKRQFNDEVENEEIIDFDEIDDDISNSVKKIDNIANSVKELGHLDVDKVLDLSFEDDEKNSN